MKQNDLVRNQERCAGIAEGDEVSVIQCQARHGNKTLHKMKLGKFVKLARNFSESAREEASGFTYPAERIFIQTLFC